MKCVRGGGKPPKEKFQIPETLIAPDGKRLPWDEAIVQMIDLCNLRAGLPQSFDISRYNAIMETLLWVIGMRTLPAAMIQ